MFISRLADLSNTYATSYDAAPLALSALTAVTASWIALSVSRRLDGMPAPNRWLKEAWWLTGSLIIGLAIWGMHLIAVLAMSLPVAYSFDPAIIVGSLLPALVAGTCLLRASHVDRSRLAPQILLAGLLGTGIVVTHFTQIAALRLQADVLYDPAWFALSLVVAFVTSWAALRIKWRFEKTPITGARVMLAPALVMGLSLMGVHLTARLGTFFIANAQALPARYQNIMGPDALAWLIAFGVLAMALLLAGAMRLGLRLQLAKLVEQSAAFHRELLDAANDGIITTNAAGIIQQFNGTAERLFGLREAHVVGQSVMLLLPESIRKQRDQFMSGDLLDLPRIVNRSMTFKLNRADGTTFDAELNITPLERGGQLELVGVVRDISRRREAEQQLRAQKEHLDFLLSASPNIVYTRKAAGSMPFTFITPNVQELFGYLVRDIQAAAAFWAERIHPDDCDRVKEARKQLREVGMVYIEYRLRYPNGEYRWISDRQLLTRDRRGKPDVVIGNWADVHDQKLDELQLRANERRMRISIECARLATWDWVIGTGEVRWSDNMRDRLGLPEDAASNFDTFIACVHPEDRQKIKAAFRQSLVMGNDFDQEYRVVWADKSVHWLHSIGGLMNDQAGNPEQMVGILFEVTEQKKIHLAHHAAQENTPELAQESA